MTEKVDENGDAWMVGDSSQSIYGFRGAFPQGFVALADNPQWKVRKIKTNYRSAPEIVEAANKLIEQQVLEMRTLFGKMTGRAIAKKYNINYFQFFYTFTGFAYL
jgi:superfamily I DNA/RNA helicase